MMVSVPRRGHRACSRAWILALCPLLKAGGGLVGSGSSWLQEREGLGRRQCGRGAPLRGAGTHPTCEQTLGAGHGTLFLANCGGGFKVSTGSTFEARSGN